MTNLLDHPLLIIACYWLFSALVGGMPDPDISSTKGYKWAYNSLHILAGNVTQVMLRKFPETLPPGSQQETATVQVTKTSTDTTLGKH